MNYCVSSVIEEHPFQSTLSFDFMGVKGDLAME